MDGLRVVDAHLHVWDPARIEYPWLRALPALDRRLDTGDLDRQRGEVVVERIVLVEADCAPARREDEVAFLEEQAARDPRVAAIVASAPLESGADCVAYLDRLAARPLVRGVRRLLQGEPDPAFCLRDGFVEGVRQAAARGLAFDACVRHPQLASVAELARRVPEATIVLDHLGKPPIRARALDPWRDDLAALAARPNAVAKLSGLTTEADPARWTEDDLRPYVAHALACFGPDRLLFGGDWPVSTLATTYPRWAETVVRLLRELGPGEGALDRVLRANAARVYRLSS